MDFIYTYHPLWWVPVLLLAFGYAFFLYRKERLLDEVPKWLRWIMAGFRFFAVLLILALLLGIVLERNIDRKEKPLVLMAIDNSASINLTADSTYYQTEFQSSLSEMKNELEKEFEVAQYVFDGELKKSDSLNFDGKSTNIANAIDQIFTQYPNRNLGAIVLATDGIYNNGLNPIYSVEKKNFIPFFTVGMGDTMEVKDLAVSKVNHNNVAFYGNVFPVEVTVNQSKCDGEKLNISIYEENKLLTNQEVVVSEDQEQFKFNFQLKANGYGYKKYTIKISELANEFNVKNNTANFYIEIIDGRQKIAIVADEPHPDIAALRYVMEKNKNYEVNYYTSNEFRDFKEVDLVVLHNYQNNNNALNEQLKNGEFPVFIIQGIGGDFNDFKGLGVGVSGIASTKEDVGIAFNPNFKDIILSPRVLETFVQGPPLAVPFGNYEFGNAMNVMAYQKVGNIELNKPLIYFSQKNNNRFGVMMGEGIWRWRLFDQARNSSTDRFEELFSKIFSFLALKENKDPFRVFVNKEFTESEKVDFDAELYNQSFDLIGDAEIMLEYANEAGESFASAFIFNGKNYELTLGNLPAGLYSWVARTNYQGKNYKKEGSFLVREVKLEYGNVRANHRLLKTIASSTNGEFYSDHELDQLQADLLNREDIVTKVYQEKSFDDIIDFKWLFVLIILLLSVEWFLRKFNGAY